MADLKQRILEVIRKPHLANLATVTGDGKPWVRYVMPVASEDMTIRLATFVNARKVEHIKNNDEVHLTCGVTDPENFEIYLQIQGRAEFTRDESERHSFWNDQLKDIFEGPDDPRYGILIVKPYRMEVNTAGSFECEVWEP